MSATVTAREDRLERVRAALVRAETSTGVRHVDWAAAAPPHVEHPRFDGDWLAVPNSLRPVIPRGGIRRGSTVSVTGSITVLLHLSAMLAKDGAWTAILAIPDLGLAATIDAGIDPDRLVLIPNPGPGAVDVLGAVVDGFGLVVVGETQALTDRARRAISQRIRHRGAVLLTTEPWPGADVSLEAVEWAWSGLTETGRLTEGTVLVRGRSQDGATRTVTLAVREDRGITQLHDATGADQSLELLGRKAG